MKHATLAVPGTLETPTGGYTYDRRVADELRAIGWSIDVLNIGEHFPHPTVAQRADAERQLAAASPQHPLIVVGKGVTFGTESPYGRGEMLSVPIMWTTPTGGLFGSCRLTLFWL